MEAFVDGQPLRVDTRKALAILALLAVERRPFAREELAALLWPESDDEAARGALRRTLSVLRAGLGGSWLAIDRATVALEPGALVDLHALDAALGTGRADSLEAAAELARGPFLAGFTLRDSPPFDDWRATWESAAERQTATVLDALATAQEASGDLVGAVTAASRRVALNPLDEPAQRRLMLLLARTGDRAGAIRSYRACVAALDHELGVPPLAETTELYEAIRDERLEPAPPPSVPVVQGTPTRLPMIGREGELDRVLDALSSAVPDGRVVIVEGEAGIGKTRLLEAAGEVAAARGSQILTARAFATEQDIPHGPVIELLRVGFAGTDAASRLGAVPAAVLAEVERLMPLPPGLRREPAVQPPRADRLEARARLLDAIASTLTALVAPNGPPAAGMIVIEDLQWCDEASREVFGWLARRLHGRGVALILAWRPEDLDAAGERFSDAMTARDGTTTIRLARLDRDAVARLVEAAADGADSAVDAAVLYTESEGLPLYVVEALATGAQGAERQGGVQALLRERLASVGETGAQVLTAAAVLGRTFDLHLLGATSGRTEEEVVAALEELVRRGLVREVAGGRDVTYDFAHARIRDAAHEATSLARRRLLHRRAAEALRAEPSWRDSSARLALVAGHLHEAGREAEAAVLLREAGRRAQALHANTEAVAHLEKAIALGYPDVAEAQIAIGESLTVLGDYQGAITVLEAAAAKADPRLLPAAELRIGRAHARRGELKLAAGHLDAAIDALAGHAGAEAVPVLVRALVERSVVMRRGGHLDRAAADAQRAFRHAEAAHDEPGAGAAVRMVGLVARDRGDLVAARQALERSLVLAASDPDAGAAVAARNALALLAADEGDRREAIALLETALDVCRRIGARHLEAAVENNLADQLHAIGDTEASMDHLRHAVAIFADIGGRPGELEPEIWKLVDW